METKANTDERKELLGKYYKAWVRRREIKHQMKELLDQTLLEIYTNKYDDPGYEWPYWAVAPGVNLKDVKNAVEDQFDKYEKMDEQYSEIEAEKNQLEKELGFEDSSDEEFYEYLTKIEKEK